LRVHADVFDRKRTAVIEKWLLLVSNWGNQGGERTFQVCFIERRLAGTQWSRDD